MKKIGLIAGLATMVTVGGVFAAWQYGTIEDTTQDTAVSITVDKDVHTLGLGVTITSDIDLYVTQDETNAEIYNVKPNDGDAYGVKVALNNTTTKAIDVKVSWAATLTDTDSGVSSTLLAEYMKTDKVISALTNSTGETVNLAASQNKAAEEYIALNTIISAFNTNVKETITNATEANKFIGALENCTFKITVTVSYIE